VSLKAPTEPRWRRLRPRTTGRSPAKASSRPARSCSSFAEGSQPCCSPETPLPPPRASAWPLAGLPAAETKPGDSRGFAALETCRRQDVFALPDVLAISILETLIESPVISPVSFTECAACSFSSGMSWLEML
jgi:hypothetical protein